MRETCISVTVVVLNV